MTPLTFPHPPPPPPLPTHPHTTHPSTHTAALAAERESLLDEVKRMIEAAQGVTECVNEMLVNKKSPGDGEGEEGAAVSRCWVGRVSCVWFGKVQNRDGEGEEGGHTPEGSMRGTGRPNVLTCTGCSRLPWQLERHGWPGCCLQPLCRPHCYCEGQSTQLPCTWAWLICPARLRLGPPCQVCTAHLPPSAPLAHNVTA
jgi:hypothetical protein